MRSRPANKTNKQTCDSKYLLRDRDAGSLNGFTASGRLHTARGLHVLSCLDVVTWKRRGHFGLSIWLVAYIVYRSIPEHVIL